MRVLICAGRHYADTQKSRQVLDAYHRLRPVQVLIHGGNQFLGSAIEDWARELGIDVVRYPPNWQRHGKQAERQRNHFMLADSRPDVIIALPGGDDTSELVGQARTNGISVLSVES
ncbi:SLOG family protein [Pseudomonas sp. SDO524_S393]